jgi:hypothetical protein
MVHCSQHIGKSCNLKLHGERRRLRGPPKRWYLSTRQHDITFHNTILILSLLLLLLLSAVDKDTSNVGSGNYLDIFYQNVRGLRTKSVESFNNVCSFDFKIVCLTETWLN